MFNFVSFDLGDRPSTAYLVFVRLEYDFYCHEEYELLLSEALSY
jgi:hypothetical protein